MKKFRENEAAEEINCRWTPRSLAAFLQMHLLRVLLNDFNPEYGYVYIITSLAMCSALLPDFCY